MRGVTNKRTTEDLNAASELVTNPAVQQSSMIKALTRAATSSINDDLEEVVFNPDPNSGDSVLLKDHHAFTYQKVNEEGVADADDDGNGVTDNEDDIFGGEE